MGWKSAVGIAQNSLRALVSRMPPAGGGLPEEWELRRDRPAPTDQGHRVIKWYQEYIDNHDGGAAVDKAMYDAGLLEPESLSWQRQVQ